MDWIGLVESIYDLETPSHDAWLTKLALTFGSVMSPSLPTVSSLFHLHQGRLQMFAASQNDPGMIQRSVMLNEGNPDIIRDCFNAEPFNTMSSLVGRRRLARSEAFQRSFVAAGEHDALGLLARDGAGWGVCICASLASMRKVQRREAYPWERIASHIHAALRLRFRLHGEPSPVATTRQVDLRVGVDALVSPSGKVEHAEPDAIPHVDSLKHAAVAIDRARARMRREDPVTALETWQSLVEGEWSLVEAFESDGRRYLVARRNPPGAPRTPLLTNRERRVLGLRARGHGVKLIAYEMGLSAPTISRALSAAMNKLGISSLAQVARFEIE